MIVYRLPAETELTTYTRKSFLQLGRRSGLMWRKVDRDHKRTVCGRKKKTKAILIGYGLKETYYRLAHVPVYCPSKYIVYDLI